MGTIIPEDFKKTYQEETDPKIRSKMLAVHMYYTQNKGIQEIADDMMQCCNLVTK